jgi:hypothetical protein
MPPRGYRDENKRLSKSIDDDTRWLARFGNEDQRQNYRRELAKRTEAKARQKAANGREFHLRYLVEIAVSMDRHGLSAHAAAEKIADEMGGSARVRHANHKTLYRKFQEAPALYRRLALSSEDPADAADREICESTGTMPRAEWEALCTARALQWVREAPQQDRQDRLARIIEGVVEIRQQVQEEARKAHRSKGAPRK